ncbi:MAG TPA: DMT family transporter [Ferruginibacter sp.]|nr:DMT family transporter [Ferruginibacter sp.]HMP20068.1 DMT family transporter [Ferruginibacter sp.]
MKKAFLQLHTAVFLAGFTAILGKLIGLSEGLLVWYRMLIAVVTLLLIQQYRKGIQQLPATETLRLLAVGGVIAIHWVAFYGSLKYGNISIAVVCISGSGFFTAFFDPLISRKALQWQEVVLGALAIAGIYIIFDFHPQYKTGILFGIVSAIGSSLFPIFNKQLVSRHNAGTLTLYEMAGGLLLLTILIPIYHRFFPPTQLLPTLTDWWWLLVLALVCTVYCFYLQLNALRHISPFTANLAYNLEPVYGILLAFVIFKENKDFNRHFYLGVALILLSVALQTSRVWLKNRYRKAGAG